MTNPLRVSVVVNTYNRAASLGATLRSLRRQNYPHFEVIVVTGPSTDNTIEVLKSHSAEIRAGQCADRNLSISRNVGIEMARGGLIAFIDDDSVPDENWLNDAVKAFDREEVGGVGGFVYDHTGYNLQYCYTVCDRLGNAYHNMPGPMPEFCYPGCFRYPALLGTNSIFRREALLEIGGFDEQFDYFLDETDVNLRLVDAGYLLKQIPNAFVYHRYLPSYIRNSARVNTNYLPIIRNRIYFGLKNAPSEPGYTGTILKDWATLSGDAQHNVLFHMSQGNLDKNTLEQFRRDLDVAVYEGIEFGLHRPRRLLHSEFAKGLRGTVASDLLDESSRGQFKAFPVVLASQEKLTICLLSQQYPPGVVGGIGRLTRDLAAGLAQCGHSVHVLTRSTNGINTVDYEDDVWVHRLTENRSDAEQPNGLTVPPHLWRHSACMLRELHRIHKTHPIDVVEAPIWDVEGIAAILDGSFRVVTSLHTPLKKVVENNPDWRANMTEERRQSYENQAKAEIFVAENAHGVRANSLAVIETMRNSYDMKLSSELLFVIPHGMEDRTVGKGLSKKGDFTEVLYAGRFEGRKGTDVLLEAIPNLCREFPKVRFTLVGEDRAGLDGTTLSGLFRSKHQRERFLNRLIFAGEVSDEKLETYLAQCDIFVAPSRYESFGLVFLEAMMFGKPVVGCRAGGMKEVIDENITGLLAEPGDPESLRAMLAILLADPAKCKEYGRAGRARYLELYTREKLAARTLDFYYQVLRKPLSRVTSVEPSQPELIGVYGD